MVGLWEMFNISATATPVGFARPKRRHSSFYDFPIGREAIEGKRERCDAIQERRAT
jgi:hypothetical protein